MPVTFPLGSDLGTALAIVSETRFAEYYTGLSEQTLHGCSLSHHFLPSGAMNAADLAAVGQALRGCGRKLTVTLNMGPYRDEWRPTIQQSLETIASCGASAVVVSNLGLIRLVQEECPELDVHVSSIAGAINRAAMGLFKSLGAKRVILPRSMRADEVLALASTSPVEIEAFLLGGGCAFSEQTCNMPHVYECADEAVTALGERAIFECAHRGVCMRPSLITHHDGSVRLGNLHPGYGACGICYAKAFIESGVQTLKVTGRTQQSADLLSQAKWVQEHVSSLATCGATAALVATCERAAGECLYAQALC